MDRCPDCGTDLGAPFRIDSKIVEEIPEPQPIIVTEYKIAHYRCPCCRKEVAAKDSGCPHEGRFGNNVIALATILKYEGRLPHRKIHDAMMKHQSMSREKNIGSGHLLRLPRHSSRFERAKA
jgi:transposase